MKKLVVSAIGAVFLGVSGSSIAQHGGGGGGHGGGAHGGGWHGGGGGGWRGGGWHGGGWHGAPGGWHRGGHGFYRNSFFLSLGVPWLWWGAPYASYPYPYPYSYPYGTYYYDDAPASYDVPVAPNARYLDGAGDAYTGSASAPVPSAPAGRWYCPDQGYYPEVRQCAKTWLRVIPEAGTPPPVN